MRKNEDRLLAAADARGISVFFLTREGGSACKQPAAATCQISQTLRRESERSLGVDACEQEVACLHEVSPRLRDNLRDGNVFSRIYISHQRFDLHGVKPMD